MERKREERSDTVLEQKKGRITRGIMSAMEGLKYIYFCVRDFRDTHYRNSNRRVSWMAAWPFTQVPFKLIVGVLSAKSNRDSAENRDNRHHYDHICLHIHTAEIILLCHVYHMTYRFCGETYELISGAL